MRYRAYRNTGLSTSLLGMGCMRLPNLEGDCTRIDEEKAQDIIDLCFQRGVNYFDTAYVYGGGASERFLGRALSKYSRDSYFLADKMPPWPLRHPEDVPRIFQEELDRCGTDYFDFYLCHNVSEDTIDVFLDEKLGVIPFLEEMQRQGKIRYLGFSSHGTPKNLSRFADLRSWDFAQIQLNYFDWTFQDAKGQYEILTQRNIPIMVMEPLRGGRLASLSPEADAILLSARPDRSVASWGLRYLSELPNIQVILSGMNSLEQLQDNLDTLSREEPLSASERHTLEQATVLFRKQFTLPCTGCGYCSGCPMELNIPVFLKAYNEYLLSGAEAALDPILETPGDRQPKSCVGCGQCAKHCPQHIDIPRHMLELADKISKISHP